MFLQVTNLSAFSGNFFTRARSEDTSFDKFEKQIGLTVGVVDKCKGFFLKFVAHKNLYK